MIHSLHLPDNLLVAGYAYGVHPAHVAQIELHAKSPSPFLETYTPQAPHDQLPLGVQPVYSVRLI
jgi:hypothetical protein